MEEEGGPSGPILRFINAVADRFPDKEISTLAYLFSVQPPRKTVPRENVSIMLCDIDCRRQTALTENPSGQEFMKALEGWSKICKNLFVWDYGINFDNYLSPFPNLSTIKDNMVIFRDHHVKMHFSQIASVRGGDFAELRSYLVNNLMWDAGASLDSLEHRFLSHYYGKAGWPIYKYIKLMEGAAVGTDVDLFIYDSPVSYKDNILRPELMRRYNALFDEAEAAVADDPVRLARVRRTRLPLQYSALEIARTEPDRDPEAIGRALDLFQDRALEFDVEMLNERHNSPIDYCRMYRSRYLGDSKDNLAFGKPVTYLVQPRPKYQKLGETALTDGIYGGTTYVESWVGWEGTDGAFIIDLGAPTAVHSISADFLHQLGAWILPGEIQRLPGRGALPLHRRHRHSGEPRHRGGLRSDRSLLRLRRPLHPGGHNGRQNLPRVALRRRQSLLVLPRRGDRQMIISSGTDLLLKGNPEGERGYFAKQLFLHGRRNRNQAKMAWARRMAGMPRLNFRFCVLCRKRYIPTSAPKLPPAMDIQMSVSSGMRHFPLRAFHLSIPKIKKARILMPMRYMRNARKAVRVLGC